nr:hypothetical protein [Tanacetum cinerariifolium]
MEKKVQVGRQNIMLDNRCIWHSVVVVVFGGGGSAVVVGGYGGGGVAIGGHSGGGSSVADVGRGGTVVGFISLTFNDNHCTISTFVKITKK